MKKFFMLILTAFTCFNLYFAFTPIESQAAIKYMAGNKAGDICVCPVEIGDCVCAIVVPDPPQM